VNDDGDIQEEPEAVELAEGDQETEE